MKKLTERQKQMVLEFCENDMSTTPTAMTFSIANSTLRWHLDRIYEKTGLNPRCFYDLVELLDKIREGEI